METSEEELQALAARQARWLEAELAKRGVELAPLPPPTPRRQNIREGSRAGIRIENVVWCSQLSLTRIDLYALALRTALFGAELRDTGEHPAVLLRYGSAVLHVLYADGRLVESGCVTTEERAPLLHRTLALLEHLGGLEGLALARSEIVNVVATATLEQCRVDLYRLDRLPFVEHARGQRVVRYASLAPGESSALSFIVFKAHIVASGGRTVAGTRVALERLLLLLPLRRHQSQRRGSRCRRVVQQSQ